MTEIGRGDVILIGFPFITEESLERKRRPAVVVQADRYNRRRNAVIIAADRLIEPFETPLFRGNLVPGACSCFIDRLSRQGRPRPSTEPV